MNVAQWIRWAILPCPMDSVPFSEIPVGDVFWWKGQCFIKETEDLVFSEHPTPRPFPWREPVKVRRT